MSDISYTEDWQNRLLAERDGLRERVIALQTFVQEPGKLAILPGEDATLLTQQLSAMLHYLDILDARVMRIPPPAPSD